MLNIYPVSAFTDNYIWICVNSKNSNAIVVDPGDASPVIKEFTNHKLKLSAILITHHHFDHTGGIPKLLEFFGNNIPVYAPEKDNVKGTTEKLNDLDQIKVLDNLLNLKTLEIPGHTLGHIAYVGNDIAFCGDTLFAAGCGRLFEGTALQMHTSLNKLKNLPPLTKMYCAHEYTLANLNFAKYVEPNNEDIIARIEKVKKIRANNLPSIPSVLEEELLTNPFLRTDKKNVIAAAKKYANKDELTEVEVFAAIRTMKDGF